MRRTSSSANGASKKRMNGPIAVDAWLSFAFDSSSAERPSTSRRFTSLPSVAPTIRPAAAIDQHDLGLGVVPGGDGQHAGLHAGAHRAQRLRLGEDLRVRADADFQVLAPGALRDQHRSFSCVAAGEPGFRLARSSPTRRCTSARIASAAAASPRARSSITRSSIESGNVTPQALTACRSHGASSHGRAGSRRSGGVLARMAQRAERLARRRRASAAAGSGASAEVAHGRRGGGYIEDDTGGRMATTAGPARSGRQTRPARAPAAPSSGRAGRMALSSGSCAEPSAAPPYPASSSAVGGPAPRGG